MENSEKCIYLNPYPTQTMKTNVLTFMAAWHGHCGSQSPISKIFDRGFGVEISSLLLNEWREYTQACMNIIERENPGEAMNVQVGVRCIRCLGRPAKKCGTCVRRYCLPHLKEIGCSSCEAFGCASCIRKTECYSCQDTQYRCRKCNTSLKNTCRWCRTDFCIKCWKHARLNSIVVEWDKEGKGEHSVVSLFNVCKYCVRESFGTFRCVNHSCNAEVDTKTHKTHKRCSGCRYALCDDCYALSPTNPRCSDCPLIPSRRIDSYFHPY
jgi:hypothetical protein